ncbi:YraN family protein [Shewanella gelidii]|uniref:UPF0102 protein GCM10009332_32320 n=1 Tax=Shewanella gelidii TaxID=1642821 RepID=A0A917K0V4_9GAMM|nr:YraN family protein [Shewanella gelidii]MCL1099590.1 YraN family protein [Shewanella gelidii]GGI92584.1 UPF0102 protein [Shewanella gelidii]
MNGISGQQGEALAKSYLIQQGLSFIAQNVRYSFGEIDLVMLDGEQMVFVEVKYRRSTQFGGALQALSAKQMKRIRQAAAHYQQLNHINQPVRLDVIAIDGTEIHWLPNAF